MTKLNTEYHSESANKNFKMMNEIPDDDKNIKLRHSNKMQNTVHINNSKGGKEHGTRL